MSRIVFGIRRDTPWYRSNKPVLRYLLGDTLKKALSDACLTSLEIDGHRVGEERAGWGPGLTTSALLSFLERFRNKPGSTSPDSSVRAGLHSFLFPKSNFDAQLAAALARDVGTNQRSEILIRGDSASLPLIVNVPWELADAVPTSPAQPGQNLPLFGTLASLGFSRIIDGTRTRLNLTDERLRVLYCVSQPPGSGHIGAPSFHKEITEALKEREGKLTYQSVTGGDFNPTFNHLKVGIEGLRPHILIIACHGQTLGGVPRLLFEEWHTVSSLAEALSETEKTFMVLLIACDQTKLEEHPAAHSGAVTVLERGILSVVAMQSSVDAMLAREFLGTTLDWFFESGEIALSVAYGRRSMAPTPDAAGDCVDWSFPALFLTEDAHLHADKFARIINSYFPALDEMLRRIPRPRLYMERPLEVDEPIQQFLRIGEVGLREVLGGKGAGKTTALLHACRRSLKRAQEMRDTSARPLLYVDFGRYAEKPTTARGLAELLRKQTEEIHSSVAGSSLLEWAAARGADGEGQADNQTRQLLRLIDLNRMILILDNIGEDNNPFWQEFFAQANDLNHSLIVRAAETTLGVGASHVRVLPLSRDETREYVQSFAPQRAADADAWFDQTAGLLGLLDLLRRADGEEDDINLMAPPGFTNDLSQSEREILYALVNLPNGVDPELASAYVSARWRDLLGLEQRGLLLRESRFEVASTWFRLPQMLMQSLLSDEEQVAEAARSLVERFIERVRSDEDDKLEENCINLARKPGGIDFLQDIHRVALDADYTGLAHSLPLFLHKWLFSHGRWYEAYRMWERLLNRSSFDETEAHEWVKLAKAAHVLGMGGRAEEFVRKAEETELTALDEIDVLILRASLIKDSGETERAGEVTALYDQILNRILASLSASSAGDNRAELDERHALTVYNRALHRRYWLRDLPSALSDLEQSGAEFGRLGVTQMQALAACEWVDIQLDWREQSKDWPEMLRRLVNANMVFASEDGSPGDCAFCYYQLARYYRRKPFNTEEEARENITKARDAYQKASEKARLAGDMRQRAIADGHLVEVRWHELEEIDAAEATERLDTVIDLLKTFAGDDWSTTVLRDMLLLRAHTLRVRRPDELLAAYHEAWDVARQPPLRPSQGTDARRAARILHEYLNELETAGRKLDAVEISVNARDLVEHWLEHPVDSEKYRGWIDALGQFSVGPGEYYGQPKR